MYKRKHMLNHWFFNRFTILGTIFLVIWGLFFTELLPEFLYFIVATMVPAATEAPLSWCYLAAPASLLVLAIHKRWFFPEYSGSFRKGKIGLGFAMIFVLIAYGCLQYFATTVVNNYQFFEIKFSALSFFSTYFSLSVMAGFAEETIFRGLLCSYLMRQLKNRKHRIFIVLLVSSIIFSAIHLTNIVLVPNVMEIVIQTFHALGLGFLLGAIFLRTGFVWPGIIGHLLYDSIVMIVGDSSSVLELNTTAQYVYVSVFSVLLILLSFLMLRPSKRKEIEELWQNKWKPVCPETTGVLFRQETPKDYKKIEKLTKKCFRNAGQKAATDRFIISKYRSRDEFLPELDILMEVYGKIIGHAMCVKSKIQTAEGVEVPVITLGSICVDSRLQRKGYGLALLNHIIKEATDFGYGAIFLTGDLKFYETAGFVPAEQKGIRYLTDLNADAPYFLCRELKEGYLENIQGVYREIDSYSSAEKNGTEV